jgi:hypothetical protein
MRASPKQADLQAIRSRSDGSGPSRDSPGRANHDMLTKYHNGCRKAFEEAIIDHGLCALCCLFGRLAHRHQRSAPCIACLREQCGRSSEPRYVQVVTAHMSHGHRVSLAVLHPDFAGIRKARRFLDGQGIQPSACPLLGVQHTHIDIAGVFNFSALLPPHLPPCAI